MHTIVVVPYDASWPAEFEKIKNELLPALEGSILAIEHVGSTSVPGLYAKPIIDIDIVIGNGMFDVVKEKLAQVGYSHQGDLGVTGRDAFKYEEKPRVMEHHLYVCCEDADELKRHIALRDHLREHADDRDRYSQIKLEMTAKFPHDIDSYIDGKGSVVLDIYRKCGVVRPVRD